MSGGVKSQISQARKFLSSLTVIISLSIFFLYKYYIFFSNLLRMVALLRPELLTSIFTTSPPFLEKEGFVPSRMPRVAITGKSIFFILNSRFLLENYYDFSTAVMSLHSDIIFLIYCARCHCILGPCSFPRPPKCCSGILLSYLG